ncbi:VC0807 family protein [Labilithrix luteola]|uniref:VC0807 family protein n=1 Tax=Labilithrix luteola TaxID=1391654 RepID=UPI0011BAAFCC|nr:VC0807 family protein [Labilithrix luteola]
MSRAPISNDPRANKARSWMRENAVKTVGELVANFVLPVLTYAVAKPTLGDIGALMIATMPPIAWAIVEFLRSRRIDAISLLVLAGVALSLLAFLGGGDVRVLQMREQLVVAVIGLAFLVSAALDKPLIYRLARARMKRKSASDAQSFEQLRDNPLFRRAMTIMTLVWGASLVAEAIACCALAFTLTIPHYLIVSPLVGSLSVGVLTGWTFWFARHRIRSARAMAQSGGNTPVVP